MGRPYCVILHYQGVIFVDIVPYGSTVNADYTTVHYPQTSYAASHPSKATKFVTERRHIAAR